MRLDGDSRVVNFTVAPKNDSAPGDETPDSAETAEASDDEE